MADDLDKTLTTTRWLYQAPDGTQACVEIYEDQKPPPYLFTMHTRLWHTVPNCRITDAPHEQHSFSVDEANGAEFWCEGKEHP